MTDRLPAVFLAHGSPFLLDDAEWMAQLGRWAGAMPRPRAVLMLSAHWEQKPVTISATRPVPLVYDFYGFPAKYYQVTYPAPAAPQLAQRVRELLGPRASRSSSPTADSITAPTCRWSRCTPRPTCRCSRYRCRTWSRPPCSTWDGRSRRCAREGVLIVGSGFLTHNLRAMDMSPEAATPSWASDFDGWAAEVLARQDMDTLIDYRRRAPGVRMALPTHEHFVPVIAAAGSAVDEPGPVTFPITGYNFGSLTKRSVQFG